LGYYDYKFRWAASSVVTFIGPDLLQILSLYTFFDSTKTAKVIIPPVCGSLPRIFINSSHECSNKAGRVEKLLNRLTTLVSLSILNNFLYVCIADCDNTSKYVHIMQRSLTANDWQWLLVHWPIYIKGGLNTTLLIIFLYRVINRLSDPYVCSDGILLHSNRVGSFAVTNFRWCSAWGASLALSRPSVSVRQRRKLGSRTNVCSYISIYPRTRAFCTHNVNEV